MLNAGIAFMSGKTARTGVLSLFDQAAVSATNFATGIIIGRTVAKEEFGLYAVTFTIVLLVLKVQDALVTTPYTVFSPRLAKEDRPFYAGSTLVHQGCLAVLAAAALLLAAWAFHTGAELRPLAGVILALGTTIIFISLREYVRRICFAHFRMFAALVLDLGVSLLQVGGLLLLASSGILSAMTAYWMTGLACCLPVAFWLFSRRRSFSIRLSQVRSDLWHNWALGKWMLASGVAAHIGAELYPIFLALFHGAAATGNLEVCRRLVYLANPFLIGMTNFLGPKTAHAVTEGRKELDRVVTWSTALVISVILLVFVVLLLFGGVLVELVFSAKYSGLGALVGILALRQVFGALDLPVNSALLAIERADIVFVSHLVGAGVTLVVGLPLVQAFGANGAAWAMVASTAATAGYRICGYWLAPRGQLPAAGDLE